MECYHSKESLSSAAKASQRSAASGSGLGSVPVVDYIQVQTADGQIFLVKKEHALPAIPQMPIKQEKIKVTEKVQVKSKQPADDGNKAVYLADLDGPGYVNPLIFMWTFIHVPHV